MSRKEYDKQRKALDEALRDSKEETALVYTKNPLFSNRNVQRFEGDSLEDLASQYGGATKFFDQKGTPETFSLDLSNPQYKTPEQEKLRNKLFSNLGKTDKYFASYIDVANNKNQFKKGGAVPTNPELWKQAQQEAKRKYDKHPSAYSNLFASKWYKEKGGKWKNG